MDHGSAFSGRRGPDQARCRPSPQRVGRDRNAHQTRADRESQVNTLVPGLAALLAVIILIYVTSSIKILAEYERGVLFRLGRVEREPMGPGVRSSAGSLPSH